MARQRNYAAEYAARTTRAKGRGFTGYGQERAARVSVKREFDRQIAAGYLDAKQRPKVGTAGHELLLKARAEVIAGGKKFERGKDKLSLELKAELRKLFPDRRQYYPIMRSLYG